MTSLKEPPVRHPTRAAIDFIANRLDLRNTPDMQDWEFEVVEAKDLPRYLALFDEAIDNDIRFVVADMTIQAFEEKTHEDDFYIAVSSEWSAFLAELVEGIEVHQWQIWCWACWDTELPDAWNVAPFMRALCKKYLTK